MITVLAHNGDHYSRVVQLDVCGQRRVYPDMGGRTGDAWVDMTPDTSGAQAPRSRGRQHWTRALVQQPASGGAATGSIEVPPGTTPGQLLHPISG